jgi:shikimate dehydrogenase
MVNRVLSQSLPITGTTRLYLVIGDPIEQVQAPTLMNEIFERSGIDAVLAPLWVTAADFAAVLGGLRRTRNLDGILITVPHKAAAARLADGLGPMAALTGVANAMRRDSQGRWVAENFDGAGFVRGLESHGYGPLGKRVSLVGGGGAGTAIAAALLAAGAAHLYICDLDARRLADLLDRLSRRWPGSASGCDGPELDRADIIINATPLGLRPDDPLPFPPGALPPGCVVADIIMKPAETALLRIAAAAGHPIHPGIHMLREQLGFYREFFGL